jgi:hypothetical protein
LAEAVVAAIPLRQATMATTIVKYLIAVRRFIFVCSPFLCAAVWQKGCAALSVDPTSVDADGSLALSEG